MHIAKCYLGGSEGYSKRVEFVVVLQKMFVVVDEVAMKKVVVVLY